MGGGGVPAPPASTTRTATRPPGRVFPCPPPPRRCRPKTRQRGGRSRPACFSPTFERRPLPRRLRAQMPRRARRRLPLRAFDLPLIGHCRQLLGPPHRGPARRWPDQVRFRSRRVEEGLQLVALDRLLLHQQLGDRLQLVELRRQYLFRPIVRGVDQLADLAVDLERDLFAVVPLLA